MWFWSNKNSWFISAKRDDRACCRRRRGVIGVTSTDSVSVGDVSMRSHLSPGGEDREREMDGNKKREIARLGISEKVLKGELIFFISRHD